MTGEALPLARIAELAHAAGARLLVDAAQLAPHRRIDLAATGIDYLALSGHKLYAPFGTGVLVGRRDWLDAGEPYLAGGGATRRVRTGTDPGAGETDTVEFEPLEVQWAAAPERHEGGTPNVVGAAALAAACRALDPVLDDALPAHERTLLDRLVDALDEIPGVDRLRIWPDCPDRVGVVSFVVDPYPAGLVAAYLSAEHGIGVRDGRFCAHPLVDRLTAEPEGAVRASLGVGTTVEDVDRLAAALTTLVTRGPGWTYAVLDGRWTPTPDPRGALNPLLPDAPAPARFARTGRSRGEVRDAGRHARGLCGGAAAGRRGGHRGAGLAGPAARGTGPGRPRRRRPGPGPRRVHPVGRLAGRGAGRSRAHRARRNAGRGGGEAGRDRPVVRPQPGQPAGPAAGAGPVGAAARARAPRRHAGRAARLRRREQPTPSARCSTAARR